MHYTLYESKYFILDNAAPFVNGVITMVANIINSSWVQFYISRKEQNQTKIIEKIEKS